MTARVLVMPDPGITDDRVIQLIGALDTRLISPCNLTSFLVDETITRYIHKFRNGLDQFMCDAMCMDVRSEILANMYDVIPYGMEPDEFEEIVDDDVDTVMDIYPDLKRLIDMRSRRLGCMGEGDAHVTILHAMPTPGTLLITLEDVYG